MAQAATTASKPRRSGGRPKKAEAERRVKQTNHRWTVAEDIHLREQARTAGLTVAEYVRRRALGLPVVVRHAPTDARLIHELNAIGVNLNQIARNLNADRVGAPGSRVADLDELMSQLRETLNRAVDAFDD